MSSGARRRRAYGQRGLKMSCVGVRGLGKGWAFDWTDLFEGLQGESVAASYSRRAAPVKAAVACREKRSRGVQMPCERVGSPAGLAPLKSGQTGDGVRAWSQNLNASDTNV